MVIDDLVTHFERPPTGLKLAFVNTAAETEAGEKQWLKDDRDSLEKVGFVVFDYTLTGKTEQEIARDLADIDILFVAGGNTFHLLFQARKCNFEKILRQLLGKGVIYIGSSAGSVIMGPDIEVVKNIDDPAKAKDLENFAGFNLVNFIVLPHWGSQNFASGYAQSAELIENEKHTTIPLTDQQYIVVDRGQHEIVSTSTAR